MSADFEKNIFVNCPFDDDYRQLLVGIVFTIMYFGYKPRLSLERADSAESRVDKILGLIKESKFGIHDLSRWSGQLICDNPVKRLSSFLP